MRSFTKPLALGALLMLAPAAYPGLHELMPLSKEQAGRVGIVLRLEPAGPDHARVSLGFETKGLGALYHPGMVDFANSPTLVRLEMHDGTKLLLSSTLVERRPDPDPVAVHFKVARSELDKVSLRILTDQGLGGVGYRLRVRDFVDPGGIRDPKPVGGPGRGPSAPADRNARPDRDARPATPATARDRNPAAAPK